MRIYKIKTAIALEPIIVATITRGEFDVMCIGNNAN